MSATPILPASEVYKSTAEGRSFLARRDERGRFVSQRCDRIGCEKPREAPERRFCAGHRRDHGARLLEQVRIITHPREES